MDLVAQIPDIEGIIKHLGTLRKVWVINKVPREVPAEGLVLGEDRFHGADKDEEPDHKVRVDFGESKEEYKDSNNPTGGCPSVLQTGQSMS